MTSFYAFAIAFLWLLPSPPQDSIAVKKPSPRMQENMPVRPGRGTAKPMPSPRYYRSRPKAPKDTIIKGFNKRDTVK